MKVMEQRPNQSAGPRDFSGPIRAAGCALVNAVYVRFQSGSKINAVGSDSDLISSGLSRVGSSFYFLFFLCTSGSGKKLFGSIRILGPEKTSNAHY